MRACVDGLACLRREREPPKVGAFFPYIGGEEVHKLPNLGAFNEGGLPYAPWSSPPYTKSFCHRGDGAYALVMTLPCVRVYYFNFFPAYMALYTVSFSYVALTTLQDPMP